MHLTGEEERALDGEYGEALGAAYRVLVAVGGLLDAPRLIPVKSVHVSGVNYANMGDAGLEFLEEFSREARVSVPTTVNPCGVDVWSPGPYIPGSFLEKQRRMVDAYLRMGCRESFSCIPYESENRPPPGSHVSWAESSASIYANSILGVWTNRESGLSALASAVTGKTPEGGIHIEENRRPGYQLIVDARLDDPIDYGLAAYYAAGKTSAYTISFQGIPEPGPQAAKQMAAAIGAAGSSSMFVISGERLKGVDVDVFSGEQLLRLRMELGGPLEVEGSIVILGCPFYGLEEMRSLSAMVEGRVARVPIFLQTSKSIYGEAEELGLVDSLSSSGVTILKGACYTLAPIDRWIGADHVYTDSIKAVHYMRMRGIDARLASLREIALLFT